MNQADYQQVANKYNKIAGSKFSAGKNAAENASDAKSAQKDLQRAEKANARLAKSNSEIRSIEEDIEEVTNELSLLERKIEFVNSTEKESTK